MIEKIGGIANHLFKNTPGKLIYYMFTLFSSFLKSVITRNTSLQEYWKSGKICSWMPYLGVKHVFL